VIIGLNGVDRLRELRDVIAVVRRGDATGSGSGAGFDRSDLREPVSLDDGEILARSVFSRVVRGRDASAAFAVLVAGDRFSHGSDPFGVRQVWRGSSLLPQGLPDR
jgi:hypothetical protein